MRTKVYKDFTLISRAQLQLTERMWFVTVTIVWPVATKIDLHTLTPLEPFGTEEEAIVEGFYLAECWVDERL